MNCSRLNISRDQGRFTVRAVSRKPRANMMCVFTCRTRVGRVDVLDEEVVHHPDEQHDGGLQGRDGLDHLQK